MLSASEVWKMQDKEGYALVNDTWKEDEQLPEVYRSKFIPIRVFERVEVTTQPWQ